MSRPLRAAIVQVNAGPDLAQNLERLSPLLDRAAGTGAQLIATPENVGCMVFGREKNRAQAALEESHPAIPFFAGEARRLGAFILAGSLSIRLPDDERLANRSILFGPDGAILARYDKIHMFDVDLPNGERYRESEAFRPGTEAVVVQAAGAMLGLSICYDLRFPHLYRRLAKAGAQILTVPAAFTRTTGEVHWHVLLRARAIETGCFVLAPAQCGSHDGGRQTFGHGLIVAPWGEVLADAGAEPGIACADLDLEQVSKARERIPALTHDREITGPDTENRTEPAAPAASLAV